MALTNPKLFGLNVRTLLADVESKNTAIQNLGINPLDLEIIKGSTNAGMSRFDWVSFSRLKTPLYKTLDRFSNESDTFISILNNLKKVDSLDPKTLNKIHLKIKKYFDPIKHAKHVLKQFN